MNTLWIGLGIVLSIVIVAVLIVGLFHYDGKKDLEDWAIVAFFVAMLVFIVGALK